MFPWRSYGSRATTVRLVCCFAAYERHFELPVRRPVAVRAVHRTDEGFVLDTSAGEWTARGLVNATGTWTRPFWPAYPGRELFTGRQLHAADYRGAAEFAGQRVVVVGGGTSAVQQLIEISDVAAATTWVTRREPDGAPSGRPPGTASWAAAG